MAVDTTSHSKREVIGATASCQNKPIPHSDPNKLPKDKITKYKNLGPKSRTDFLDTLLCSNSTSHKIPSSYALIPSPPTQCPQCFQVFSSRANLAVHDPCYFNFYNSYHCFECQLQFFWIGALLTHYENCHCNPQYRCSSCSSTFFSETQAKVHVAGHGAEYVKFICRYNNCSKIFLSYDRLRTHMYKEHFDNVHWYHRCQDCGEYFKSEVELQQHGSMYHGTNVGTVPSVQSIQQVDIVNPSVFSNRCVDPNECPVCGKNLKSKARKDQHMKDVHQAFQSFEK